MRTVLLASALAVGLTGTAFAQQQSPQDRQQQQQQRQQMSQLPPDSDSLLDKKAIGSDGKDVGKVKDVVVTPNGQVAAVIIDGDKDWAVPWNQLKVSGDQLSINMNEDQLSQLPEYKDSDK